MHIPDGHAAHVLALPNAYEPRAHTVIDSDEHEDPGGHGAATAAFVQSAPIGHVCGEATPGGQKLPLMHAPDAAVRPVALQNEPAGQASGADRPVAAHMVPTGQALDAPPVQ